MKTSGHIRIGYISKTHGLKGEVTAVVENEIDLNRLSSLFIETNGMLVPYFIEGVSGLAAKPFLKFDGIDTLGKASILKGCVIYISKSARSKSKRGEFYDDEVIGFKVEDKSLGVLGQVKEIQSHGINRLMVIIYRAKEILIPLNAPFIRRLNKARKSIELELPEGYLDF
jgi:16S rRNA processing protein RimM